MKQSILFILLVIVSFSCKTDKTSTAETDAKAEAIISPEGALPDACSLVSESTVARLLGIDGGMTVKDGNAGRPQKHNRSCFFKWEDNNFVDAGILIQVMTNPIKDEAPEYLAMYIDTRKKDGESKYEGGEVYPYHQFDMGTDGAYSHGVHKYLWRDGYKYGFMIMFNYNLSEERELAVAKEIASEVMKNFKKS